MNGNLRILMKERNKIAMMANCLSTILEYNLSAKSPILAFMIVKNINHFSEKLKNSLQDLGNSYLCKKIEKPELFVESNEFKNFSSIIQKEISLVLNCLEYFKSEIVKVIKHLVL